MADNLGSILFNALSAGVGSYGAAKQENADKSAQNKLKTLELAFKLSQDQRAQQAEVRAQQDQQNQNELFQIQRQIQNNVLAEGAAKLKELTRRMSMTPQERDAEDAAREAAIEAKKYAERLNFLKGLKDAEINTSGNIPSGGSGGGQFLYTPDDLRVVANQERDRRIGLLSKEKQRITDYVDDDDPTKLGQLESIDNQIGALNSPQWLMASLTKPSDSLGIPSNLINPLARSGETTNNPESSLSDDALGAKYVKGWASLTAEQKKSAIPKLRAKLGL